MSSDRPNTPNTKKSKVVNLTEKLNAKTKEKMSSFIQSIQSEKKAKRKKIKRSAAKQVNPKPKNAKPEKHNAKIILFKVNHPSGPKE